MIEYVLMQDISTGRCWYGFYDKYRTDWSEWKSNIMSAINTPLDLSSTEEVNMTLDEFINTCLSKTFHCIYRSTLPIDPDTFQEQYPELFI